MREDQSEGCALACRIWNPASDHVIPSCVRNGAGNTREFIGEETILDLKWNL